MKFHSLHEMYGSMYIWMVRVENTKLILTRENTLVWQACSLWCLNFVPEGWMFRMLIRYTHCLRSVFAFQNKMSSSERNSPAKSINWNKMFVAAICFYSWIFKITFHHRFVLPILFCSSKVSYSNLNIGHKAKQLLNMLGFSFLALNIERTIHWKHETFC